MDKQKYSDSEYYWNTTTSGKNTLNRGQIFSGDAVVGPAPTNNFDHYSKEDQIILSQWEYTIDKVFEYAEFPSYFAPSDAVAYKPSEKVRVFIAKVLHNEYICYNAIVESGKTAFTNDIVAHIASILTNAAPALERVDVLKVNKFDPDAAPQNQVPSVVTTGSVEMLTDDEDLIFAHLIKRVATSMAVKISEMVETTFHEDKFSYLTYNPGAVVRQSVSSGRMSVSSEMCIDLYTTKISIV